MESKIANNFSSPFLPGEAVESSIFIYVNYLVILIIKMGNVIFHQDSSVLINMTQRAKAPNNQ